MGVLRKADKVKQIRIKICSKYEVALKFVELSSNMYTGILISVRSHGNSPWFGNNKVLNIQNSGTQ